MGNKKERISDYVETSGSSPKQTRPSDRQMGLGTHNYFEKASKDKKHNNE